MATWGPGLARWHYRVRRRLGASRAAAVRGAMADTRGTAGAVDIDLSEGRRVRVPLRPGSTDAAVLAGALDAFWPSRAHAVLLDQCYQALVAAGRTPLVVDAGAYTGITALLLLRAFPRARILALEPDPANGEVLDEVASGIPQITAIRAALGPPGRGRLLRDPTGAWGHQVRFGTEVARDAGEGAPVEGAGIEGAGIEGAGIVVVSLAGLLADQMRPGDAPFLCKIDIEGGEADLPPGDWRAAAAFPALVMEPHDWRFPGRDCARGFLLMHLGAEPRRDLVVRGEHLWSLDTAVLAAPVR